MDIFAPFPFTSPHFVYQTIVCKLKPIIFLPGDYICKKGDVGMEMFIVSSGAVQVDIDSTGGGLQRFKTATRVLHNFTKVVGGPNDSIIFVTLGPGVCFGEIALLGTGGMNRRTASIKVEIYGSIQIP